MSAPAAQGRGRRVARSKVAAGVAAVLLVAVSAVAYRSLNPLADYQVIDAPVGEVVPYYGGTIEVDDVRVGSALRHDDDLTRTAGLYVVVRVTVSATGRDEVRVQQSDLLSSGPTYQTAVFNAVVAPPGFATSSDLVFEVDPLQMTDLTLEAYDVSVVHGYHQRAHTFLGITAANAASWAAAGRGRTLAFDYDETSRALS